VTRSPSSAWRERRASATASLSGSIASTCAGVLRDAERQPATAAAELEHALTLEVAEPTQRSEVGAFNILATVIATSTLSLLLVGVTFAGR
jgi:hypothetical protein